MVWSAPAQASRTFCTLLWLEEHSSLMMNLSRELLAASGPASPPAEVLDVAMGMRVDRVRAWERASR